MKTSLLVFACVMCTLVVLQQAVAEPVEDFLPDTNGLFFGKKRASHPNMNNLLFGRRSYGADALRVAPSNMERAYALCMNIKKTYESLGLQDDVEVPEH